MAVKSKRPIIICIILCIFIALCSVIYFQVIKKPDVKKLEAEADVLLQQRQLEAAEQRYKEAVTAQQSSKELDTHYPELLNKLAAVNEQMGEYEKAEKYYTKALSFDKSLYGLNHSNVAADLNNLATLLNREKKHTLAAQMFSRALEIDRQYDNQLNIAIDLQNLGFTYHLEQNLPKAEFYYEKALELQETTLGRNAAELETTLNNLRILYKQMRKPAYAKKITDRINNLESAKNRL